MKLSFVSCLNEEALHFIKLREYEPLKQLIEIIFINDGSKDKTSAIASFFASSVLLVTLVSFLCNLGKESLFAGFE